MNGDKLKAMMILKHIGVQDLCAETGINITTFWRKCRGDTEFKQSEIRSIAKVLKLTNSEMVEIFF